MIISLEKAKQYCRIDGNDEDELLKILIENAKYYIEDAVDELNLENNKVKSKAELLAAILVSDWYDNRSYMYSKSESPNRRHGVQSLILQIKALSLGDEDV